MLGLGGRFGSQRQDLILPPWELIPGLWASPGLSVSLRGLEEVATEGNRGTNIL